MRPAFLHVMENSITCRNRTPGHFRGSVCTRPLGYKVVPAFHNLKDGFEGGKCEMGVVVW